MEKLDTFRVEANPTSFSHPFSESSKKDIALTESLALTVLSALLLSTALWHAQWSCIPAVSQPRHQHTKITLGLVCFLVALVHIVMSIKSSCTIEQMPQKLEGGIQ